MANEKRLISLDEALKATHSEIYWTESQQAAVRSFLVKQPKVDAVEVVRCKDCAYFRVEPDDFLGVCKCGAIATNYGGEIYPKREHFCSCGERRTGRGQE